MRKPCRAMALAAAVLAMSTVAACSSSGGSGSSSSTPPPASSGVSTPAGATSPGSSGSGSDSTSSAGTLAQDYADTSGKPPSSGPTPKSGVNIWWIACSTVAQGCDAPGLAAQQAASHLGWKVNIVDGKFGVGDGYNVAIRQAIAAQATAIVLIGIDCKDAKGGLIAAKSAKIPTIAVASIDCADQPLFTASEQMNEQYPSYPDWWQAWGAAKARWLIAESGGKAQVLDTYEVSSTAATIPIDGFRDALKACSGCKVVSTVQIAAQDLANGVYAQKFSSALVANPTVNTVVVPLDTFTLAGNVPAAIAAAGRKITVVGGEGLAPAMDFLRAGKVDVEIGFSTGWLGWGAIDTINRVLNGQPAVPEGIGWQTVDNTHNLAGTSGGYETKVDYKSAYLKLWGKG